MRRLRKWLLATGIVVGVPLVALAGTAAWLVYTPSGLRFALDRGVALMHGRFAYASASGTLAGTTTIDGLRYRDADGTRLEVAHASVELRPWALLARRLHIVKARIDGVTLDLAPSKPGTQTAAFPLRPPLTLALDDVALTRISVHGAGKPVFAADRLALAGVWSARRLVLRALALTAPAGHAELTGTLAIARGYRGQGTARFDWTGDGTRYAGAVSSQSDGMRARVEVTLGAPTRITARATIGLGAQHDWTLALAAPPFDARVLSTLPASLKTLALNLRGGGDARGGSLTGDVVVNGYTLNLDPATFRYANRVLSFDPLRVRSPQIAGTATVTGDVHLGAVPIGLALDVRWQGVSLPAGLVGQPLATQGDVRLGGTLARYTLKGALALGPSGRTANLTLDLAGTPRTLDVHALKLVQGRGGLDARGRIELAPQLSWKLEATAQHFDPGAILPSWSGDLGFALATAGTLGKNGPAATLQLGRASGTLRGRSIAGSRADLQIKPGNLLDGSATLVAGQSRIEAVGRGGARTDATLTLAVASLGDWLPGAAGSLAGRFRVTGAWPRLAVNGDLRGRALRVEGSHIDALALAASVPNIAQPGGTLELALQGVHAAGLELTALELKGSGTAKSQHVRLQARGPQLNAALALSGTWSAGTHRWSGTLDGIELAPHGLPTWHQQRPAAVRWQRGAFTLDRFCLGAGASRACATALRDARGALSVDYGLTALPLQLLAGLVPLEQPLRARGEISGTGRFTRTAAGAISGSGTLAVDAGDLAFAGNPGRPLLAWSRLDLEAGARGATQHVRLDGALDDGGAIHGEATISGPARALAGTLNVNLRNVAFIEALSTEAANVKGELAGSLELAGTLSAPRFQGRIATTDFSAELPRAGLKLRKGQFALTGDNEGRLAVTGQLTSGQGVLHFDGRAGLATGTTLDLSLRGTNVLVADIPAARVIASPDLAITRSGNTFHLTGTVTIPEARIEADKLPGQGPVHASPDVVIVDAPPAKPVTPLALQADMQIKLGDHVKVHGYGLDGSAHGQLAVHVEPGQTATGRGEIRISGKYQAYGQDLTIQQGRLLFAGTRLDNPGLDIRAVRSIRSQSVTVGLSIRGTAQRPVLTVFSDPAMEQAEALSYLVTGRPLNDLKSGEGDTLGTAAQALGGLAGDRIAKTIGTRLGLEAGVSSSEALGGSAFTAGKYLSPRLFLSYGVGLFTPGQVVTLRYTLNRFLQFEAENATTGTRASLNYRIEK
ncbi:MAG TPA: translocation/assembly module TamB domain-containing protein [Rhodanobacteraceae bacterium]|nr:translocation/assembly module TamB domain-containing protein [Rhodanobacteraceae bacterium]